MIHLQIWHCYSTRVRNFGPGDPPYVRGGGQHTPANSPNSPSPGATLRRAAARSMNHVSVYHWPNRSAPPRPLAPDFVRFEPATHILPTTWQQ